MVKKKRTSSQEIAAPVSAPAPAAKPSASSPARRRISFSISSDPDTVDGHIVNHLRNNKMVNMRESVVRALKAYYLPWAYEDEVSQEEAQVLARGAIDELEFRIFQIRRHFLAGESYGPKLSESLGTSVVSVTDDNDDRTANAQPVLPVEPSVNHSAGRSPRPITHSAHRSASDVLTSVTQAERAVALTAPASLVNILADDEIDPDVLDDF